MGHSKHLKKERNRARGFRGTQTNAGDAEGLKKLRMSSKNREGAPFSRNFTGEFHAAESLLPVFVVALFNPTGVFPALLRDALPPPFSVPLSRFSKGDNRF